MAWFRKETIRERCKRELDEVERSIYTAELELLRNQTSLDWLQQKKALLLQMHNRPTPLPLQPGE